MRTVSVCMVLICAPVPAAAQSLPTGGSLATAPLEYQLGGAATFSVRTSPTATFTPAESPEESIRFPVRVPSSALSNDPQAGTVLGDLLIFGSETQEDGRDVVRLGTAIKRGRTTTGVSFSYYEDESPTRSEVFVDYALTDSFSLGVSGIMSEIGSATDEPVTRLGLSAAYATGGGSFVQGGIADAPDTSPVFGVSMGLRF
ncbi:MAG: hypothetical protein KJO67_15440 [Silicimonas sp.]|nr:hypothetical protein [Silicimonas sp.]NNL34543.1 hypothetical protein [Silicimonas sp.]